MCGSDLMLIHLLFAPRFGAKFFSLLIFFTANSPPWCCMARHGATKQADGMLRETAHEMSLIAFEKKQLLQQWKGALIRLARRDEALVAATNALKEAETSARYARQEASIQVVRFLFFRLLSFFFFSSFSRVFFLLLLLFFFSC